MTRPIPAGGKGIYGSRAQFRELDRKRALQAFGDNAVRRHRQQRDQERVRQSALDLATADPTKIVQVRRCNCRWCWGANNEYQRSDWELSRDLDRFMAAIQKSGRRATFPQMGGGGYNKWRDPNPDCPICCGEGEEIGHVKDFRKLSARERNSIASVKFGKGGSVEEIKFHNKIDAIREFAKIDGMVIEKRVIRIVDASDKELDDYFKQNAVTIDHNDPDFAPFLAKMTDAESVDLPVDQDEDEDASQDAGEGQDEPVMSDERPDPA